MTTVGSLVAAVALAVLVDWVGATTWQSGLAVGGVIGIGFVATTALQTVPFEDRPWPVYLLGIGYNVVALAGIGRCWPSGETRIRLHVEDGPFGPSSRPSLPGTA